MQKGNICIESVIFIATLDMIIGYEVSSTDNLA